MNTKIDIISGFLGAGKTTLIQKLINNELKNEKIAIIENEFGEVGIDGQILKGLDIDVKEINSGCICCTLSGDFKEAIIQIIESYSPTRIVIEPSGVAKLSDILKSCRDIESSDVEVNAIITVVDAGNGLLYLKNFGEFYKDQVKRAKIIQISKVELVSDTEIYKLLREIKKINSNAKIIKEPIEKIDFSKYIGEESSEIIIKKDIKVKPLVNTSLKKKLVKTADNNFSSWSREFEFEFTETEIRNLLKKIALGKEYGNILRAKGIVKSTNGKYIQFNYVPNQFQIDKIGNNGIGKVCVIGTEINREKLEMLFLDRG